MKTIKAGKTVPIWVGRRISCLKCEGIFELEQEDKVTKKKNSFSLNCPTNGCEEVLILEKFDLESHVDVLNLTTRSRNCLLVENVETILQLVQKSEMDLRKVPNFGYRCLGEVQDALKAVGLRLNMTELEARAVKF